MHPHLETSLMPFSLPYDAEDPASFSSRLSLLQRAFANDVFLPGPPVVWLVDRYALADVEQQEGLSDAKSGNALWWAGGAWRHVPLPEDDLKVSAFASVVYNPDWRHSSLLHPLPCPGEALPDGTRAPADGSGVAQFLKVLVCNHQDGLWAKQDVGGAWSCCPFLLPEEYETVEAFEIENGDRYYLVLVPEGGLGQEVTLLHYDVRRGQWLPAVGPARVLPYGHEGAPAEPWRATATSLNGIGPSLPTKGWILECSATGMVLLTAVGVDGVQYGTEEDVHAAIHFIGDGGQVISHHLPCSAYQLTIHRYDSYVLFVKESPDGEEGLAEEGDVAEVAAWLLSVDDVAVPPMPVVLPSPEEGWWGGAWSIVLVRGSLQDSDLMSQLGLDMAPRLYLLEDGPFLRLWASRRVDEGLQELVEIQDFDGRHIIRHALSFQPLEHTVVEVGEEESSCGWLLWSGDLRHAARIQGPGASLQFSRCGMSYEGKLKPFASVSKVAYAAPAEAQLDYSNIQAMGLEKGLWSPKSNWLPAEDARSNLLITGLPAFPVMRRAEGNFERPEDEWLHPIGATPEQIPPISLLR